MLAGIAGAAMLVFGCNMVVPISSGIGGHAVFYLNGVCRVDDSHYPVIRLCDESTPAAERGVGISVNAHYKNANWIATPGREFFFHGGLAPGEPVTRAAYQRTQDRAKAMGILDGIEFHDGVFEDAPPKMSRRALRAMAGILSRSPMATTLRRSRMPSKRRRRKTGGRR